MVNAINDGLNKPSIIDSVNGQMSDFGSIKGSGNTSVVTFRQSFTAAPVVYCFPAVGSVAVANLSVLSNIGTGSFSVATGSNITNSWFAIGSGTY